jgi:hypothetical protein
MKSSAVADKVVVVTGGGVGSTIAGVIGATVTGQRLTAPRVAEALGRALGTGRVFTSDVEVDERKAYARRAGTS